MTESTEQNNAQPSEAERRKHRDASGRFLPGIMPPVGKPWQPGSSGNPNGRGLEAELKNMLAVEASRRWPGLTKRQGIARAAIEVAEDPTHPAFGVAQKLVWERHDGSVPKTLRLEGELPLKVVVRAERD